jgi:DNA ligase (NAD+)
VRGGEVYMTEADFAVANEMRAAHGEPAFAHPRSAAAGTLRAQAHLRRAGVVPGLRGVRARGPGGALRGHDRAGAARRRHHRGTELGLRTCTSLDEVLAAANSGSVWTVR